MKAKDLAKAIKGGEGPCVVDVRSGFEFKAGHIPGALHAPSWRILLRLAPLPRDKEALIVVTCEHGPRAQLGKSFLALAGYRNTVLLEGHMARWRRERLPLET